MSRRLPVAQLSTLAASPRRSIATMASSTSATSVLVTLFGCFCTSSQTAYVSKSDIGSLARRLTMRFRQRRLGVLVLLIRFLVCSGHSSDVPELLRRRNFHVVAKFHIHDMSSVVGVLSCRALHREIACIRLHPQIPTVGDSVYQRLAANTAWEQRGLRFGFAEGFQFFGFINRASQLKTFGNSPRRCSKHS